MLKDKIYQNWKDNKISIDEANKIPEFNSHEEARKYFKNKYGNNFQMIDSNVINNEKIYSYHLILNLEQYKQAIKEFAELEVPMIVYTEEDCLAIRYMFSHQKIEISEQGLIHIIH